MSQNPTIRPPTVGVTDRGRGPQNQAAANGLVPSNHHPPNTTITVRSLIKIFHTYVCICFCEILVLSVKSSKCSMYLHVSKVLLMIEQFQNVLHQVPRGECAANARADNIFFGKTRDLGNNMILWTQFWGPPLLKAEKTLQKHQKFPKCQKRPKFES